MKKLALIAAVVFTTLTLQSCRESEDMLSPEEAATLQKVQDSAHTSLIENNASSLNSRPDDNASLMEDGEIAPPPRR